MGRIGLMGYDDLVYRFCCGKALKKRVWRRQVLDLSDSKRIR